MLLSELYKIIVNKATFVGFRGANHPPGSTPLKYNIRTVVRKSSIGYLDILKLDKNS